MKLSLINNLDFAGIIENASELNILSKYRDKDYVQNFLGLFTNRSYYYGLYNSTTDSTTPLKLNETSFKSSGTITLLIEGVVVLKTAPVNTGEGSIAYKGYGVLEINGTVVYNGTGGTGDSGNSIATIINQTSSFSTTAATGNGYYRYNSASSGNATINSDACSIGESIFFRQVGAGVLTFVAGSGVTINENISGDLFTSGVGDTVSFLKISSTEFDMI